MMRKVFVGLLVGAVTVGLAAPAFAADLKFTGAYRIRGQFDDNLPCMTEQTITPDTPAGGFRAPAATGECSGNQFQTRFRPRFDVETEGGVKGVLRLEIGDVRFGGANSVNAQGGASGTSDIGRATTINAGKGFGGGANADGVNVETKWAYIDFPVPATPFRLRGGIQPFFLSKALFLDDDGSGLSLYGKLGEVNTNIWWFRTTAGGEGQNARDLYGLDLSTSPMKDLNLNAYLVYDHDMTAEDPAALTAAPFTAGTPIESLTGFWVGVGAAGKVQNIRWDLDFVYGTKELTTVPPAVDQKGWGVDGGVGMALAGTPLDLEVRGWYFTGDEQEGGDSEAFPVLYAGSGGHEPGTQVWGGGGDIDIDALADNPQNTWGFGLIARYTVSPTLKVTGNVHYIGTVEEGTAAGGGSPAGEGFIGGVDAIGTEVGVKIDYTIARGLVFTLTGGYLFLSKDTPIAGAFEVTDATTVTKFEDVGKLAFVLNYNF